MQNDRPMSIVDVQKGRFFKIIKLVPIGVPPLSKCIQRDRPISILDVPRFENGDFSKSLKLAPLEVPPLSKCSAPSSDVAS